MRSSRTIAMVILFLGCLGIYGLGLHPGVDAGDSAELQYSAPLLGICHPPGYQFEISVGWIAAELPIGNRAWRVNLLMAICGALGAVILFDILYRITGRFVPGLAGSTLLAFSSTYWSHALVAESYVFAALILLLGLSATVHFLQSGRLRWLIFAVMATGTAIAERPSELFVLPAFGLVWAVGVRRHRIKARRWGVTLPLLLLPFLVSVALFLLRNDPERLGVRDDALRDQILTDRSAEISRDPGPNASEIEILVHAVDYCAGLTWARKAKFDPVNLGQTIRKFSWMLSGLGAWGDRFQIRDVRDPGAARGTALGFLGLLLALYATYRRRQPLWILFGWGLLVGNLFFIAWHATWDSLTFTIPALIGVSLLAGLGCSWDRRSTRLLCLVAPLLLFVTNVGQLGRNGREESELLRRRTDLAQASWPSRSVVLCSYWTATTLRYLFYVEAGRVDCNVICAERANWQELLDHFDRLGRPVYLPADALSPEDRGLFARHTEATMLRLGFVRIDGNGP